MCGSDPNVTAWVRGDGSSPYIVSLGQEEEDAIVPLGLWVTCCEVSDILSRSSNVCSEDRCKSSATVRFI